MEKGSQEMPITKSQARALRMKYAPGLTRFDIPFSEVASDVATLLEEVPNPGYAAKYDRQRADHGMRFFIAADDVNWLLDRITAVDDPKPAEEMIKADVEVEIEKPKENEPTESTESTTKTDPPEPPADPPTEPSDKPPTETEGQPT